MVFADTDGAGATDKADTAIDAAPAGEALDAAAERALARLYGEPLFELPADLYIPPDALEIFLDAFEGPLDLLLYLIRKQNFNILDIPMVPLTQQYLGYVEEIRSRNLELAAEYLLMAAMLIEIKSRMLLPRPPAIEEEDAEDPRAQLVRRLLEYEKTKQAAQKLAVLPQDGRDFFVAQAHAEFKLAPVLPSVRPEDLQRAWLDIIRRSKLVAHHTITREKLSVREYMSHVLRDLRNRPYVPFEELFRPELGIPVLVVTFIAMLELAKETLIEITQAEAYAPIYVVAHAGRADDDIAGSDDGGPEPLVATMH
ncbi:segregation/condensation protein A [Corticibacter populi]|uniref:Segregation and condensation protein A n=1 Tax=Corticibacter populi TaxID=1550736 RepID=A0A3M6QKJ3_9BURK|nr:ScpA family protein [Corticibacter populi]RMX03624.1 segregation/condensation protein A [Corticibacter populi]